MSVFKRLFFDLPGIGRVDAMPGGSHQLSGFNREPVVADTGMVGTTEEPVPGEIEFELPNKAGISRKTIAAIRNGEVTVQDDGGQTWHCFGCAVTTPPKLSGGKYSVKMVYVREEEVR